MKNQLDVIAASNIPNLEMLTEGLQCEIDNSIYNEENPDFMSWQKEVGVLITRHEAELFLELLINYIEENE